MSAPQMDCCLVRGSARQLRSWDFDFLLRWLVKTFEREEIQEKMREVLFPLLALPSSLPPLLPLPCGQWHSIFYLFHQQRLCYTEESHFGDPSVAICASSEWMDDMFMSLPSCCGWGSGFCHSSGSRSPPMYGVGWESELGMPFLSSWTLDIE